MKNKYYTNTIHNGNKSNTQHRNKEILRKGIRYTCGAIATISIIYIIGTAGSLELDQITCGEFAIRSMVALIITWISMKIGGFDK